MARALRSMTGFGRGDAPFGGSSVAVEVRSVNSRHLDLRVRLPRDLQALEAGLRQVAAPFFARGQVEISVRLASESTPAQVEIDLDAARRYAQAADELGGSLGLGGGLAVSALLSLPGVARLRETEIDLEGLRPVLTGVLEVACRAAQDMRTREGDALAAELEARLDGLERALAEIEGRADEVSRGLRERLDKRLAALAPELELTPGRVEQEVVIYVDRMDVTEETVRLRSHAAQFRETLQESGSVGRKLEFLLQEMGREVNTIGSKAQDVEITRNVVELKTELEKLREQVLNVE